jgi:hypothetical protein
MYLVEENEKVKGVFKSLILNPDEDTVIAPHSIASITIDFRLNRLTSEDLMHEIQLDYPVAATGLILAGKSIGEKSITLAVANITKKPVSIYKENPIILVTFGTRVTLKAIRLGDTPKGLNLNLFSGRFA